MKRFLVVTMVAVAALSNSVWAADVGVSVSVGQPGFYGQIDIGNFPPPQVIYREPKIVQREHSNRPPVYLRVPPGHAKHWSKNCAKYNACGERVYFVQDGWYNREYAPAYRKQHGDRHDERKSEKRGKNKEDHEDKGRGHGRD